MLNKNKVKHRIIQLIIPILIIVSATHESNVFARASSEFAEGAMFYWHFVELQLFQQKGCDCEFE